LIEKREEQTKLKKRPRATRVGFALLFFSVKKREAEENQERKYNNTTTNHKTTDRINTGTNISPANLQKSQHTAKPWQPSWTTNIHKSMKTSERPHVHQTGNVLMAKASRTICGGKNSRTTWIRFGNQNSRTP